MEDLKPPPLSPFLGMAGKHGPSGLPKYAQLRETLNAAILAGHWQPGSKLPTESELTRLSGFSLGTVQRSLRELADEGVLIRSHGSGTFVAKRRPPIDAPLHLRFVGGDGEPEFLPLFPKVMSRTITRERGRWSEHLQQDDAGLVRIDRKMSVNGEFIVFNRMYYKAETFPDITARPLDTLDGLNLKQMLGEVFNLPVRNVEQRVSLTVFTREAVKATGVRPGSRGLLLESAAGAGHGSVIYFMESFIPPNSRRLDVSAS
jgi:GntR family transcriptional regulator